ncbi:MAG: bis(5'-nucleosyl)-tetraphosphatase (symmetrical) YqeK, partial [Bacillota bacterium]
AHNCEIAALLHDCTKCMSLKAQQQIARDNNLKLLDMELDSVGLLHGPVSAVIAKEKYGIQQKDILAAIGAHTTGFAGMSEFDMVIFLADKIEPYRSDLPQLDEIRALANVDLYQAAYLTLCNSKEYILQTNRPLHPATDKTIQWVHDSMQRKENIRG